MCCRTLHSRAFSLAPIVMGLASKFAPVVASALELQCSAAFPSLTEVNFHDLLAGFVRNYDLFWHFASFFVLYFYFYQFRFRARRNLALRERGLITNSSLSATIGFLLISSRGDSSPRLVAALK